MTKRYVYRHKKNGRLYKLYHKSPPLYTGSWDLSEDLLTGETRELNNSTWKMKDFEKVYEI